MVGAPISTEEYLVERAVGVVRDGGADCLACCLPRNPGKQSAALTATESLGQRTSYLERSMNTDTSLEACHRADNGAH